MENQVKAMHSSFLHPDFQRTVWQLLKYGVVGLVTNLVGYLIYLAITYLGGTPKMTMSVLYVVGTSMSFFGNRRVTFAHHGDVKGAALRFLIAYALGYLLNLLILMVGVDRMGYPHQLAQLFALFVVAAFLFVVQKVFVFSHRFG